MRVLIMLLLCISTLASCQSTSELVQLPIPPGFEGPYTTQPGPGSSTSAYLRKIPGQSRGTLLQVTTYEFGSKLAGIPKEELGNGAENYLLQFLAGVQRRRTSFRADKPTRIQLGGLPAARIEWAGTSEGYPMTGVMYCVIVGTVVVSLHTQGFEDSPASDRAAAVRAIEAVTFGGG